MLQHFTGGAGFLPHQTWPDPKSVLFPLHPLKRMLLFRQCHPSLLLSPPFQLLPAEMILKTLHCQIPSLNRLMQQSTALHLHLVMSLLSRIHLRLLHSFNKSSFILPKNPVPGHGKQSVHLHPSYRHVESCHVVMDQVLR